MRDELRYWFMLSFYRHLNDFDLTCMKIEGFSVDLYSYF